MITSWTPRGTPRLLQCVHVVRRNGYRSPGCCCRRRCNAADHRAIQHAKAAGVPVVVAVNKIVNQKPIRIALRTNSPSTASCRRVGRRKPVRTRICKSGYRYDELLDAILLQAEVLELKAVLKVWRAVRLSNPSSIKVVVRCYRSGT